MGRKSLAEQRRMEIIHAFYQCVISDGLGNASIRKIADQAGVQPSTLHHYFKDRDEMIEIMVAYFSDMIFEQFTHYMKQHSDPKVRFQQALQFLFSGHMINEEYTGFFLECCAEARRNNKVRATLAEIFKRFRKTIITCMDEIDVLQNLDEQTKKSYAAMIVAIHEGMELQWHADPGAVFLDDAFNLTRTVMAMVEESLARRSDPVDPVSGSGPATAGRTAGGHG